MNHWTYVLASDGDMMEGVTSEAASLAGTLRLGRLIVLYDANGITLSATTNLTFSEDVGTRFESYGWHVQQIDGHDRAAVDAALAAARAVEDRRISLSAPSPVDCPMTGRHTCRISPTIREWPHATPAATS